MLNSSIESLILEYFNGLGLKEIPYCDIRKVFLKKTDEGAIKASLDKLVNDGKLEHTDSCFRLKYPSVTDILKEKLKNNPNDKNHLGFLLRRLSGDTLEMIAKDNGVTRERVRQICLRHLRLLVDHNNGTLFDEDYYKYLYEKYQTEKELWIDYIGVPNTTFYYLSMRYSSGAFELEKAVDDGELDYSLKQTVKRYLRRNQVLMPDGTYIKATRAAIEDYLLPKFCTDGIRCVDFLQKCNEAIFENNNTIKENLLYSEDIIKSRINRLANSLKCLWKRGGIIRFYDIGSKDYTKLLSALRLERFENIDISTLKFIEERPGLMRKYDIRDQYELHNLLKKILDVGQYHNIHFGRQPILRFGE